MRASPQGTSRDGLTAHEEIITSSDTDANNDYTYNGDSTIVLLGPPGGNISMNFILGEEIEYPGNEVRVKVFTGGTVLVTVETETGTVFWDAVDGDQSSITLDAEAYRQFSLIEGKWRSAVIVPGSSGGGGGG